MIYLIRHGQSTNNVGHCIGGQLDMPLNDYGKEQCNRLCEQLKNCQLDAVFCSPLARARDSAKILAESKGLDAKMNPDITEIDFGDWQGLTFAQVAEQFPEEYEVWVKDWTKFDLPGGENFRAVQERTQEFYELLQTAYRDKNVAIVAHQGILRVLLSVIMDDYKLRTRIRNTGIVAIDFEMGQPQIIFINDFEER